MLEVKNVSKAIKSKEILHDINCTVNAGDCLALIGPNGAGKTTLMLTMLGDLKASSGTVTINDQDPKSLANKKQIAFLKQENVLPNDFKVKELIEIFQDMYPEHLSIDQITELLDFPADKYNQLSQKLSGGQKRLLAFILCLIGKPQIVFLDEPTAGMDTSTRQRFWEIIDDLKKEGKTIVYSSHYIEEVEHTADRILVLNHGYLLRDTTPYAMRNEETSKQFTVPIKYKEVIINHPDISDIVETVEFIQFKTNETDLIWDLLKAAGCQLSEIELQNKTLLNTVFDATNEKEEA